VRESERKKGRKEGRKVARGERESPEFLLTCILYMHR
jgi:hypothetical protein